MKVSVVGVGVVGAELVRGLMGMAEIDEIIAINRNRAKVEGEIEDLYHTTAFSEVYGPVPAVGDYPDLAGSDIVVLTAGAQPRIGGSREDVLFANCKIAREITAEIERYAPQAMVLMVTNPVDAVTQVALAHSGFAKTRLISTGTIIDSRRLVRILSDALGVDPRSVSAYVMGEHGPSGFIPWSLCRICGMDVDTYCRLNDLELLDKELVQRQMLEAGHRIFNRKGNTSHGISASVNRIIRAIVFDEKAVLPVGMLLEGEYGIDGVVLSVPCVIGRAGVERMVRCDLSGAEVEQLQQSGARIRQLVGMATRR
ncbi:MAG TPA: hypothetical protein VNW54_01040 [Granulicella sp.]|jgi:L-lactate dehydrogenase|nr:hypothetical protein [Granulicella sp.]